MRDFPTKSRNSDVNARLRQAVHEGDLGVIDGLIRQGADPFCAGGPEDINIGGQFVRFPEASALLLASRTPHILSRLLPQKISEWTPVTRSPFCYGVVTKPGQRIDLLEIAIEAGALDTLKLLLDRVDTENPRVGAHIDDVFLRLIDSIGADRYSRPHIAMTLLLMGHPNGINWLRLQCLSRPCIYKETALEVGTKISLPVFVFDAVLSGHELGMQAFKRMRRSPSHWTVNHAANEQGDSMLHLAARSGNLVAVDLLLDLAADTTLCNHAGTNPVETASAAGHHDVVHRLRVWRLQALIGRTAHGRTMVETVDFDATPSI